MIQLPKRFTEFKDLIPIKVFSAEYFTLFPSARICKTRQIFTNPWHLSVLCSLSWLSAT